MKCFYHNDIDGRSAGAIVSYVTKNKNTKDFFEVDYVKDLTSLLNNIKNKETVYFVDYSFKENTKKFLDILIEKDCEIIWIDHHTDSIITEKNNFYLKNIKGIRKEGISGAALTYMYFYKCTFDEIPYFLKLVSDYDCWQFKYDPDTTCFKLGIESMNFDALDNVWQLLMNDRNKHYDTDDIDYPCGAMFGEIIDTGEYIKNYIDKDNDYYRSHFAYESEIQGYKCLVVNKKSNSWIFGSEYNNYPVVITWVFNGEHFCYSLFSSNPKVECNKLAEIYGGGGHKGAAGFVSDQLLFKKNQAINNYYSGE